MKQLYKVDPAEYIVTLPPTPAQFLREHRALALKLFSREEPPVAMPLCKMSVDAMRGRIVMRGRSSDCQQMLMGGGPVLNMSMIPGLPLHT